MALFTTPVSISAHKKGLGEGCAPLRQRSEIPAKFPSGHCGNNYACMQLMFPDWLWSSVPAPSLRSPVEITRAGWNTQPGQDSTPWKTSQPLLLQEMRQPTPAKKENLQPSPLIWSFIANPTTPTTPKKHSVHVVLGISEMALMYFLWLSTISCYVRYLSGDFRLRNRLHWELSLRSGPVWIFSSLSIAVVHSTVFFLYCLACLYKIFTLNLRMLQIYPLVAHVIFQENPGFWSGFVCVVGFLCFALAFFPDKILSSWVWLSSPSCLKVSDH